MHKVDRRRTPTYDAPTSGRYGNETAASTPTVSHGRREGSKAGRLHRLDLRRSIVAVSPLVVARRIKEVTLSRRQAKKTHRSSFPVLAVNTHPSYPTISRMLPKTHQKKKGEGAPVERGTKIGVDNNRRGIAPDKDMARDSQRTDRYSEHDSRTTTQTHVMRKGYILCYAKDIRLGVFSLLYVQAFCESITRG